MGEVVESVRPQLADLLVHDDWQVRMSAWFALRAPDGLRERELDAFIDVQRTILQTSDRIDHALLRQLGPRAAVLVPALIARLETQTLHHRGPILGVLSTMGRAARPAVPWLVEQLGSQRDRLSTLEKLALLGPVAAEARDAVERLLSTTRDARLRAAAEKALASFGP